MTYYVFSGTLNPTHLTWLNVSFLINAFFRVTFYTILYNIFYGEEETDMHTLIRLNLQRVLHGKMTEDNSTTSHLPDAMTTTEETQITGGNTATSSLSPNIRFYFQLSVLVIGVIGTAANALILYTMMASKQHVKHMLIFNQNALDLFSCIFLVITYPVKLFNIPLTGSLGYWLCTLILSDMFVWIGSVGSVINLATITVDRYLKVVHSVWSKKKLRRWMVYFAMAFAWIGSAAYIVTLVFSTTAVMHGRCLPYAIFKNKSAMFFHYIWYILSFYVIILFIFIFCYGHILIVIRRQAKVMASHTGTQSSTNQTQSNKIQTNVIKTMIIVSAFYASLWSPYYISLLIRKLLPSVIMDPQTRYAWYYVSVFIAFLYTCINPFIYATKFEPVKQVLLHMIPWKKTAAQATENVVNVGIRLTARRTGDSHARN